MHQQLMWAAARLADGGWCCCCCCCPAQFMEWSRCVCDRLQDQGYWCDYIDPCSGLPVRVLWSVLLSSQQQREVPGPC